MLDDIKARLKGFGFTAEVAMADTPGAAWALARFGSRQKHAAPQTNRQALKALYLGGLRLDQDALVLLRRLGLTRIGQLYHLPRAALTRRFKSQEISAAVMPHKQAKAESQKTDVRRANRASKANPKQPSPDPAAHSAAATNRRRLNPARQRP